MMKLSQTILIHVTYFNIELDKTIKQVRRSVVGIFEENVCSIGPNTYFVTEINYIYRTIVTVIQ